MPVKLNFRVSVKKMLLAELVIAALSFILAIAFPDSYEMTLYIVGFCLAHIVAYSPIGLIQGFDFIMHDHPADSFLGFYHFVAIIVATIVGVTLSRPLAQFIDELRKILIG